MLNLQIVRRAFSLRLLAKLMIILLSGIVLLDRLSSPRAALIDAPYPLRLLATAEPSTLLLLILVLALLVLVGRDKKAPDEHGIPHDEPLHRRS